jgi:hypothetical protein
VEKPIIASRSGSSSTSRSTPTGILQQHVMLHSNACGVAIAGAFSQAHGMR